MPCRARVLPLLFLMTPPTHKRNNTLPLHDALPIWRRLCARATRPALLGCRRLQSRCPAARRTSRGASPRLQTPTAEQSSRSEEHTSELQSQLHLVSRLLLEKKKQKKKVNKQTSHIE